MLIKKDKHSDNIDLVVSLFEEHIWRVSALYIEPFDSKILKVHQKSEVRKSM